MGHLDTIVCELVALATALPPEPKAATRAKAAASTTAKDGSEEGQPV
jgi:hypothetical protein